MVVLVVVVVKIEEKRGGAQRDVVGHRRESEVWIVRMR